MSKMEYLSPSSLGKFKEDRERFFLEYLAESRMIREPQTQPMAVGSAFDAFVKSYLHERLFGKDNDLRFKLDTIFEAQVESQNRDEARVAGKHVFDAYLKSGALTDMMLELNASVTTPRFEFDLFGQIADQREERTSTINAIPLLGKPDLFYTNSKGARIIHDWKVNGYYAKYNKSPAKGYIRLRHLGQSTGAHKDAIPMIVKGVLINVAHTLEMVDVKWAAQLAIYMWLCGEPVGTEDCFASIDQVACSPSTVRPQPDLRFAEHRCKIGRAFQFKLMDDAIEAWEIINSDHYFRNLTKEVSQEKCATLNNMCAKPETPQSANDQWHDEITSRKRYF